MVTQDGQRVAVDPGDAKAAVREGLKFAGPAFLQTRGGEIKEFSPEQAESMLSGIGAIGMQARAPEQFAAQEERKKYDSLPYELGAVGAGVARGATFGLSDQAIANAGGREFLQKSQEYSPWLSVGGEVAGAVAPLLLSGGSSSGVTGANLAARGGRVGATLARGAEVAGALPRGVAALGRGAEAFAGRGLAELGMAEAGIASRAVRAGVSGLVEGSLYGAGSAISEAAIQDHELTAEKVLAAMGHGAIVGGAGSGGLSLAGALLARGAQKIAGGVATLSDDAAKVATKIGQNTPKESVAQVLDDVARSKAIQATGATASEVKALAAHGAEAEARVAKQVLEDLPEALGKKARAVLSKGEIAEAAEISLAKKTSQLDTLLEKAAKVEGPAPDLVPMIQRARAEVLAPLEAMPGREAEAAKVARLIDSLESKAPASLEALRGVSADVAKQAAADPLKREIASRLEETLIGEGEKRLGDMGAKWAAEYRAAKEAHAAAKWIHDAASSAKETGASLADRAGLVGGLALGAGAALAQGEVNPSTLAYAAAGGLAQGLARKYGAHGAAVLAKRAAEIDGLRALATGVDDRITGAVGDFLSRSKTPLAAKADHAPRADRRPLEARYAESTRHLGEFLANPEPRARAAVAGVYESDPKLSDAVVQKAIEGANFLKSKLPPSQVGSSVTPNADKTKPSPGQMSEWLRYQKAVNDPASVLEDLRDLDVSPEGVEALKVVYPRIFAQAQAQMMTAVAERDASGKPLSYQQKIALGTLFDAPTDPSLEPGFVQMVQASYQVTPGPQRAGAPSGVSVNISHTFRTRAGAIEAGDQS